MTEEPEPMVELHNIECPCERCAEARKSPPGNRERLPQKQENMVSSSRPIVAEKIADSLLKQRCLNIGRTKAIQIISDVLARAKQERSEEA